MSSLCVTCSSDQDVLVSMSDIEWNIFCLLLYPHENIAENSKSCLEELKNSNFGRICIACQNTLASIGLFRKCARLNFKKFVDMWNTRRQSSNSIIEIPVTSLETIKLESVDINNAAIIIEDSSESENENEYETVLSSPSTMSVNSDDIQRIKEEEEFGIEQAELEIGEEVLQNTSQPDLATIVLNKYKKAPEKGSLIDIVTAMNSAAKDPAPARPPEDLNTQRSTSTNPVLKRYSSQHMRLDILTLRAPVLRSGRVEFLSVNISGEGPSGRRKKKKRLVPYDDYSESYVRLRPDGCQCRLCVPKLYNIDPVP